MFYNDGENSIKNKKVFFQSGNPQNFRTTLIGHLYEICQVCPTVLLSEGIDDPETENILKNKELFPKLEKIIPVPRYELWYGKLRHIRHFWRYNRNLHSFLKNISYQYKPELVVLAGDMNWLFEMYLMRFAKRIKARRIAIQATNIGESVEEEKWVDLVNAYSKFPGFLPLSLRIFLVKCRKYFRHHLFYWLLPLTVGEKPFFGKSSFILKRGRSGMRDAEYQIVFSKKDYDTHLRAGVPAEKLYILAHPLSRKTREFFEKIYFNNFKKDKNKFKNFKEDIKIVSLMLPGDVEFGLKKDDYSLISPEERKDNWIETIKLISQVLPEWKIYIKPHPRTKNFDQFKKILEPISKNIRIVSPKEPADKYIEIADAIIELPRSGSTVLFTASLRCPEKPILSLDFYQELLGDYYKVNSEMIEYIDNKEKFINILELIRDNKYQKSQAKLEAERFSGFVELLEYLLNKKNNDGLI